MPLPVTTQLRLSPPRLQATCCQRGTMGFCKILPFLTLTILVLYHLGFLQAAPIGFAADNCTSPIIAEEESEFVLVAVVQGFDRIDASELDLEKETEVTNATAEKKPCSNTDCLTRELLDLLSLSEDVMKKDSVPTDVDDNANGHPPENVKA
ncbi:Calcitonin gene-related peptide 2 [Galemys pyrenaicus]|uniref:Calcitonin gene-related peptide 2 n=1 Tax=Galemys pyrenaicus TaxID=202257 RepID=A0A8J6DY84_GALPY|nr:Calcitonin gene-related peptide 2 [Galemys pyrenaicus]